MSDQTHEEFAWDTERKLRVRIEELQAENKRLRDALTLIKNYCGHPSANSQTDTKCYNWSSAALQETDDE